MTDRDAKQEQRLAKLQAIVDERLKEQAKVTADRAEHPAFFKGGDYA